MMQNRKLYNLIGMLLFSVTLTAQDDQLVFQLRDNIREAFDRIQAQDTVSVESELEDEVASNYFHGIRMLNPEKYKEQSKAGEIIRYYYSTDGIFEILTEWKADTIISDPFFFLSKKLDDLELKRIKSDDTISLDEPSRIRLRYLVARNEYNQKVLRIKRSSPSAPDKQKAISKVESQNVKLKSHEYGKLQPKAKDTPVAMKDPMKVVTVDPQILEKYPPVIIPPNLSSGQQTMCSLFLSKDKYATLIVDNQDIPEASVFLDKKFIDTVDKVKNGILVKSKHLYDFVIQLNDSVFCQGKISLGPNERKSTGCISPK